MPAYIQAICAVGTWRIILIVLCIYFSSLSAISFAGQVASAILPTPVISSQFFPCSRCHKQNRRVADVRGEAFHATVRVIGHTEEDYGCFDCHDTGNMDQLRLFNGSNIDIALSSELCGQCHSTNYKLWQPGLHGKVIGKWNGPKQYTPCTTCHNPHQPRYKPRQPGPPPTHPEQTLRWRK